MKRQTDLYSSLLKQYWGYDSFRGIQREIIESIGSGQDTLGLMPTGGGKSITFQVPALALKGVCVVISPLIALMKDQVQHLRDRGIRAAAIYSGMTHDEVIATLENAVFGAVTILYISPERLSSELFIAKLRHMKVSFICVDEAHCISQWGYDFRPSYLKIAEIRKILPSAPILALTATATPEVVDDIQRQLHFAKPNVFRMSFERSNLAYIVRHSDDKLCELINLLSDIDGSAIVYTRSRENTRLYADMLSKSGFSATFFHAGLDDAEKDRRQKEWMRGDVRVIVATNAFGMGIDKPDVRLVAHVDCPDSIEAYFQEAGRAGRDGKKAYAVLITSRGDVKTLLQHVRETFPPQDFIRKVYDALAYYYQIAVGYGYEQSFEFDLQKFCAIYHFQYQAANSALVILSRAGYIAYSEDEDVKARVMFMVSRDDLYRYRDNSHDEELVVESLLRTYSGLFSSFCYIDESAIGQQAGLSRDVVHRALVSLAHRKILRFIPRSRTSFVRYVQRREESKHLQFPRAIYEDLYERLHERVLAVIEYITNDEDCRSVQLLDYFGEKTDHSCGQCDVCTDGKICEGDPTKIVEEVRKMILSNVADGEMHSLDELQNMKVDKAVLKEALQYLIREEIINVDANYYWLP